MAIITKTTYNYEYKCPQCGYLYSEHRGADESAFFTKCFTCAVNFELINQSETVVEEQIPDPVVTEEIIVEVIEEPVVE